MERMVGTRVQHMRGGDRCVGCLRMGFGCLRGSGSEDLGPSVVVAEMVIKGRKGIWSVSHIFAVVSWWVGFLVPVCLQVCRGSAAQGLGHVEQ